MKSKTNNRKLRKYNKGYNPGGMPTPFGIQTNYAIPKPSPSAGMKSAMAAGTNDAMSRAGDRIASQAPDIAGSVLGAVGAGVEAWKDPELAQQKTSMTRGPLVYEKTALVNSEKEFKDLSGQNTGNTLKSVGTGASAGAAIGSVIPGAGAVIGGAIGAVGGLVSGLLGGGKRKRAMKRLIAEQNERTGNKNTFNQSDAHTDQLQQEYASQNENTQDDQLYNKGKTPFVGGKDSNSLVGKGETIVDGDTGDLTEVQHGSAVGTDDVPALINPQDAIAGNLKSKVTGNTFAEDMKPLTRMESRLKRNTDRNIRSIAANTEKLVKAYTQPLAASILQQQALQHRDESKSKYNWGKVGEYAMNGISDIASLAPTMYNFYQGLQSPDQVSASELYSPNANAQAALTKMGKRRYNQAPELEALRGLESRQRYNARQLGSEGGLNRAMDVAGALGTRRSISDVYAKKQNVDNQYLGEEASMAAQLGAQEAQARTMAMREAYDINAKNKAMQKQYQAAGMQGVSEFAQMGKKNRNLRKMDSAKLRMAERYMGLGTTASNIDYIFGNLR